MKELEVDSLTGALPKRVNKLGDLAYNLWWTWHTEAQRLFMHIDSVRWRQSYGNPVKFLKSIEREKLVAAYKDKHFLDMYDGVIADLGAYMRARSGPGTWFGKSYGQWNGPVCYMSFEFGLNAVLPLYAGGLGVLAGDHLKEASDLGVPMVGVGFLYLLGYFSQRITEDGWQEADYVPLNFDELPITRVMGKDRKPLIISFEAGHREYRFQLWKAQVGRVPLYLIDTNLPENPQSVRALTMRLYNPDPETRIAQEILLGVGGVKAIRALGIDPAVWHMNEGHPAFSTLERARELVQDDGLTFAEAQSRIRETTVFTTHTPVPAGNDQFAVWQIDRQLNGIWNDLGLTREEFMATALHEGSFGMTVLALRMAGRANGVSKLHGHVANDMWKWMFPGRAAGSPAPIGYITNGIHAPTWIARRMKLVFNEYLGSDWLNHVDEPELWDKAREIPDHELWEAHKHYKRRLVNFMLERARDKWITHQQHPVQTIASGVMLDPNMLTIGFARRFPTYKRATLILRDVNRLLRLVTDPARPVQIIYAGKSHPNDEPGKRLIQDLYRMIKNADSAGRLVFIENYDMTVARFLVQGVDVWMNTPRRPYEASGTSGMKAALNGALNFSVLDGWWPEAYNGKNGWAIGTEQDYDDPEEQDASDVESLYSTLENEIIPTYYDQDDLGTPHNWIEMMKESIATAGQAFTTRRMLKQYVQEMYAPQVAA